MNLGSNPPTLRNLNPDTTAGPRRARISGKTPEMGRCRRQRGKAQRLKWKTLSMWNVWGKRSIKWASAIRYPKPPKVRRSLARVDGSHDT